ncbi:GIY-YIG nuclease family protein [Chitinophaga horti]|uniref:GIY-YIG nuclease family protein n=1 Tax=Chitinophaga horti TaxID=2920382 RepID=A0ABY6JAI6_9BACT|nr:GIY-YIG nuclease family protein [Chitinophaga horti]UYQ95572.1 GIY-YIG nuclease family protein [Chitinophaga horti]
MEKGGFVYIMTNKSRTVLYTGVTSDLLTRVNEHRSHLHAKSFTARYHLNILVYYEVFVFIEEAITEEKRIKGGSRASKTKLIEQRNPGWMDLYDEVASW